MINTLLLMIAGFAAGYLIAALWRNRTELRRMKSQSAAFGDQRKELDAALHDALKTNKRLQEAVLDLDASRMKAIRAWQKNGFPGRLHEALGISESELHTFVYGPRAGQQEQASLNPDGFLLGLNEDMRKALQREEIDAKIEAWHNSDCAGSLHEFLGMSADEQAAFVEKDHNEGLWENVGADQRNQSRKPA